jgi:hypothetical protein
MLGAIANASLRSSAKNIRTDASSHLFSATSPPADGTQAMTTGTVTKDVMPKSL